MSILKKIWRKSNTHKKNDLHEEDFYHISKPLPIYSTSPTSSTPANTNPSQPKANPNPFAPPPVLTVPSPPPPPSPQPVLVSPPPPPPPLPPKPVSPPPPTHFTASKPQTTNTYNSSNSGTTNCPVCGSTLYTTDQTVIAFHVDECLAKALDKPKPYNQPVHNPPSNNPSNYNANKSYTSNYGNNSPNYSGNNAYGNYNSNYNTSNTSGGNNTSSSNRSNNALYLSDNWTVDSFNPFALTCPYPSCGKKMEAKDFYHHATTYHSSGAQNFACPICSLTGIRYTPNSNTNLINHLNSHHSDLKNVQLGNSGQLQNSAQWSIPDDDFIYDPSQFGDIPSAPATASTVPTNVKVGSKYIQDTVKEYIEGKECTICFEEFEEGQVIARMDCFCVFHKKCIDSWLEKSKKCPLHKD